MKKIWTRQHWRAIFILALARAREERITQVAGSLTFTTTLALVPMLTIALALFAAFPLFKDMRVAFQQQMLVDALPPQISAQVLNYVNLFAAKAKGLTALGLGFLAVTAISMMLTIDKALNEIWHVRYPRPLAQRMLVYWAALSLGPVLLGASLSATSYLRSSWALDLLGFEKIILEGMPTILMALAYSALYMLVPNRPIDWRHALVGGGLSAIVFELMKTAFAWYITRFPSYTAIYGGFAALPIFLLWIYLSWLVTLFGAAVTAALPSLRYDLLRKKSWHPGARFVHALLLLRELHLARHAMPQVGLRSEQLQSRLRIHADDCDNLLSTLEELGLVGRINMHQRVEHWVLLADPGAVTMGFLYENLAFSQQHFVGLLPERYPALHDWLDQLYSPDCLRCPLATVLESQSFPKPA